MTGRLMEHPDLETRILRALGLRLPRLPHASAVVNRLLKPWYLRKRRPPVTCDVLGRLMELEPAEAVDGNLLFCPQLYDAEEVRFLLDRLPPDAVFVDIGAHKGFYSLMASTRITTGTIVAVEANPVTFAALERNVRLNGLTMRTVNCGVSDREEMLLLNVQVSGNTGGSSFLGTSPVQVPVRCVPLLEVVAGAGLSRITWMKLDIEGFEYKVLAPFLAQAPATLHPRFVLTEWNPDERFRTGDVEDLLLASGYRARLRTGLNRVYEKT
jgi:FkbM family methyltransferase